MCGARTDTNGCCGDRRDVVCKQLFILHFHDNCANPRLLNENCGMQLSAPERLMTDEPFSAVTKGFSSPKFDG